MPLYKAGGGIYKIDGNQNVNGTGKDFDPAPLGDNNIAIGELALEHQGLPGVSTFDVIAIGNTTAQNIDGNNEKGVLIGKEAGQDAADLFEVVGIGFSAVNSAADLSNGVFIGNESGEFLSFAFFNVAIGPETMLVGQGGDQNVAIGDQAMSGLDSAGLGITGDNNVAIGVMALAGEFFGPAMSGDFNVAIGEGALRSLNSGENNISLGSDILGENALRTGDENIFIGNRARSLGAAINQALAIGFNSRVNGERAIAIGVSALSVNTDAMAVGHSSQAAGLLSTAVGGFAVATVEDSTAVGSVSRASGTQSTAIGADTDATAADATAIGSGAQATAPDSVALGSGSDATAADATAIGSGAQATAPDSVALGSGSNATASGAVQLGAGTNSTADSVQADVVINANDGINLDGINSGVSGNVTINAHVGIASFAVGQSQITVTNDRVSAGSHVFCQLAIDQSARYITSCVVSAGSFTAHLNLSASLVPFPFHFLVIDNI